MRLKKAHIPALAWSFLIASSCLLPASTFKPFSFDSLFQIDKLVHITLYFGFYILWGLAVFNPPSKTKKTTLVLYGVLFGVGVEILQHVMSVGRNFDIFDIIANSAGCLLGYVSFDFINRKLPLLKKYLPFIDKLY